MPTAMVVQHDVQRLKDLGAVYTPGWLAEWLTQEVSQRFGFAPDTVLDPAAGEGALLAAAQKRWPVARLIAMDIDPQALRSIPLFVGSKIETDAVEGSWPERGAGTHLILANPPWGASLAVGYRKSLEANFALARGQYDSYDLFVERIVTELGTGGIGAIFLPDSLLLHQHKATRDFLAKSCTIHGIYRLGEGVFPNVSMGTIAIIFSGGRPSKSHRIKYARLRAKARAAVIGGDELYPRITEALQECLQSDLENSTDGSWSFDAKHNVVARSVRNISGPDAWKTWFKPGRGLEIGKNGDLLICPVCGGLRSIPRSPTLLHCATCNTVLDLNENRLDLVRTVHKPVGNDWVPLAVGHDLHRHTLTPTRWIRTGVPGVDYKNELDSGRNRRLLVRKTGLGIHAAVEWEPTATTQTIYNFSPTEAAPDFAAAYAAGMLSSRVLTAWHMTRSGDLEWRSHPYLTISSIQSLPLPEVKQGTRRYEIAKEIAQNVSLSSERVFSSSDDDLKTEHLVAEILGHGSELVEWALETLDKATGSSYIRDLVKSFRQREIDELEAGN